MFTKFLDPKNDLAFKKIFGSEKHKDILIHFINDVLHFEGADAIVEVTFINNTLSPEIEANKRSELDVFCKDGKGTEYIVEMQVNPMIGFEKRAQYYAAKAYAQQLKRGSEEEGQYPSLRPVIFIAVMNHVLFGEKEAYHSRHKLLDQVTQEWDLKDMSFVFLELGKFKIEDVNQLTSMVEKWCYFFKHAEEVTPEELKKLCKEKVIADAFEILESFYWTKEELYLYDQHQKRIWDDAAIKQYQILEAEAKGKAEGKAEGKTEALLQIILNAQAQGLPLKTISLLTGLSENKIEVLLASQTDPV